MILKTSPSRPHGCVGWADACSSGNFVAVKTPPEQKNLKRQIDATDKQIDKLVYELHGLAEEEIRIVENQV